MHLLVSSYSTYRGCDKTFKYNNTQKYIDVGEIIPLSAISAATYLPSPLPEVCLEQITLQR